jgi:hypothetical protein
MQWEGFMSLDRKGDSTRLFTVVGAPYVAEQHADARHHLSPRSDDVQQPETGVAALWLLLYGCIIALSLLGSGGAFKLMELAGLW